MKRTLIWGLLAQLSIGLAFSQMPSDPVNRSSLQLNAMAEEVEDLRDQLADLEKEVGYRFQDAESRGSMYFWGAMVSILFAIGSGPFSVLVRTRLDRKRLDEIAEVKVREKFDASFPAMAEAQLKAYLDRKIPAQVKPLIDVSNDRAAEESIRQTTKILVLAENEKDLMARMEFLRGKGYKHIAGTLPVALEKFPPHDICLVDHLGFSGEYDRMNWKYLNALFKNYDNEENQGIMLCFSKHVREFDFSLIRKKGFANMEATIDGNLLKLIRQIRSQP